MTTGINMKGYENKFTLDGTDYKAIQADYYSCVDCAFSEKSILCENVPHCTPDKRSDGRSVIFKIDEDALAYKELEAKYKEAQSLLDACYEIVEIWDCQAPSQIEWKREWLEGARRHGVKTF